jgi:hypothetical protein
MAELNILEKERGVEKELGKGLERLDEDLSIMERHAAELAEAEAGIREEMRRRDREYKDACLHSVPKPRKHLR